MLATADILNLVVSLHTSFGTQALGIRLEDLSELPAAQALERLASISAKARISASTALRLNGRESEFRVALLAFPAGGDGLLPYPARLSRSLGESAPPVLYVCGNADLLSGSAVAIIGMRRPSAHGINAAIAYAMAIADMDVAVVSGNAPGIDAAAHGGALDAGGCTIVFPPTPIEQYHPQFRCANADERLVVASPFVPGSPVAPWNFLARNALVAGYCDSALVAETGFRGGTHDTIRRLKSLERTVFALDLPKETPNWGAHQQLQRSGCTCLPLEPDSSAVNAVLRHKWRPATGPASIADLFE